MIFRSEAEALRKEKKRSNVTGLHQYLHLLDPWTVYPCLTDSDTVISFPPVTNSDNSRISETTTTVMIEVTASSKLDEAKMVMDQLLVDMTDIWPSLSVIQARVLSQAGELKVGRMIVRSRSTQYLSGHLPFQDRPPQHPGEQDQDNPALEAPFS